MEKVLKRLAAVALIGMTMGGAFGCAYGGIAASPDGSIYVSRNDLILFGLLRKIYRLQARAAQRWSARKCLRLRGPR